MADNIIRLKIDSTEYDAKLKKASEGITRYVDGCRKVGGTLEVVEKETLQYVRAMGQMTTQSRTTKGTLAEMTKAFTDLSMQYNRLTKEEKASPFGQTLNRSLGELKGRIRDTNSQLATIKQELDGVSAGGLNNAAAGAKNFGNAVENSTKSVVSMQAMLFNVNMAFASFNQLTGTVNTLIDAYKAQEEAELKLQTIMRQRMNATDGEIAKIKELASAQQEIGVVGDEVQLAGAQQVATFLKEKQSIETLLPAMNNLAVQRKGLNVTSEDMVNIGNLVGKVMQGQTSALTRVGITLDEAQEKVLKYGTESERAAMLAQVITDNVGNMNAELAKTDAGKAKQLSNAFGDTQEEIGGVLSKYQAYIQILGQGGMAITGVITITNAFASLSKAIGLTTLAQKAWSAAQTAFAGMQTLITAAINGTTLSTVALRAAIKSTILSLGLIGAAYYAVSTAVTYLVGKFDLFGTSADTATDKTKNLTDAQRRQAVATEQASARQQKAQDAVGAKVGELTAKYATLQTQWNALKTTAEKTKWIEKNQSAFNALGMSVNSINDAYDYFVKNSTKVVAALTAIAEANAYTDLYEESLKKEDKARRNVQPRKYAVAKAGQVMEGPAAMNELSAAGLPNAFNGNRNDKGQRVLTASEARQLNAYRAQRARNNYNDYVAPFSADSEYYKGRMQQAQAKAVKAQGEANLAEPGGGKSNYRSNGSGKAGAGTASGIMRTQEQLNSDEISRLTEEYVSASDTRRASIRSEIKDLQEENAKIKALKDEAQGKGATMVDPESLKGLNDQLGKLKNSQNLSKTNAEWTQWGAKIDEVEAKISAITKTSGNFAALTTSNMSGFISSLRTQIDNSDLGSELFNKLTEQLRDATAFQSLLTAGINNGADFSDLDAAALWRKILEGDDPEAVKTAVSEMLAKVNDAQGVSGGTPFTLGTDGSLTQDTSISDVADGYDEAFNQIQEGWSNIEGIGNGIRSMTEALQGNKSAWERLTGVVNGFFQIMSSLKNFVKIINDITAATNAETLAKQQSASASASESVANATASAAEAPWYIQVAVIAAAVAAVATALASMNKYATGGLVGGNSFSGDNNLVRVNSGELILNRAQQGNLAAQLDDANADGARLEAVVSAENISFILNNRGRRTGSGELTSNNNTRW